MAPDCTSSPTKSSACLVTSAFASSALAAVQLWGAFLLLHLYFGSPLATRNMCAKGSIKLNGSLENGSQGFWSLLRRTSTVWLQYYLAYTTVCSYWLLLVQLCQSVGPHFSSFLFLIFLFNFCTHFSNLNRFEKKNHDSYQSYYIFSYNTHSVSWVLPPLAPPFPLCSTVVG